MVTLFMLFMATLIGVTSGLLLAAFGVRRKAVRVINKIDKKSEAYLVVLGEIITGQIDISDIVLLQTSGGVVGIVADEIEFYMEEEMTKEEILDKLYQSLFEALEDENLDLVQPLEKFNFGG